MHLRLSRIAVTVLSVWALVLVVGESGCTLTSECEHSGDIGGCSGPRSHDVCIGGEGQYHYTSRDCASGEKCVETNGRGACLDESYGAACTTRETCGTADCLEGICGGFSDAVNAWCESPPEVTPIEASATHWAATFSGSVPSPPAIYGPNLVPSACGTPAGGVQMVRIAAPGTPAKGIYRVQVEAKVAAGFTARVVTYQRGCGSASMSLPIRCAESAPLEIDSRRGFDLMIASPDANAEPVPYTLAVSWDDVPL
jgi:hypothetical protein